MEQLRGYPEEACQDQCEDDWWVQDRSLSFRFRRVFIKYLCARYYHSRIEQKTHQIFSHFTKANMLVGETVKSTNMLHVDRLSVMNEVSRVIILYTD